MLRLLFPCMLGLMTIGVTPVQGERTCIPDVVICGVYIDTPTPALYDIVEVADPDLWIYWVDIWFNDDPNPTIQIYMTHVEQEDGSEPCDRIWDLNLDVDCANGELAPVAAVSSGGDLCFLEARVGFTVDRDTNGSSAVVPLLPCVT